MSFLQVFTVSLFENVTFKQDRLYWRQIVDSLNLYFLNYKI